eukprot:CAMPEP_0178963654 /NCGR_PEP_ID=MMETSP0789-20121207/15164_1 /TAXON_ID=3005 /ORGANISM="Rhizosolenia setigera, Strain CCMP 1694" /LENGTH=619 /DNA_ID=CAMNT_0020648187 /DNA_START=36 /DNA_END=1895 /DNA_ORIENTATION=-
MAALTRPTEATYTISERVTVNTSDHEDHTFCGIAFPVECKEIFPVERIIINSISVRGRLGPLTVWVTNNEEIDEFQRQTNQNSMTSSLLEYEQQQQKQLNEQQHNSLYMGGSYTNKSCTSKKDIKPNNNNNKKTNKNSNSTKTPKVVEFTRREKRLHRSIPLHKSKWTQIYSKTHAPSVRRYDTLDLSENPIILTPGQVRGIYIHSTEPGDHSIVYDNYIRNHHMSSAYGSSGRGGGFSSAARLHRARLRRQMGELTSDEDEDYEDSQASTRNNESSSSEDSDDDEDEDLSQDSYICIKSGMAHVSDTKPFGKTPIWGWGNAWRKDRKFVGRLEYGVVYKLWNPKTHIHFTYGKKFRRDLVENLLGCQRNFASPIARLPDECIFYICNMCKWDWVNDTEKGMKKEFKRRQKRLKERRKKKEEMMAIKAAEQEKELEDQMMKKKKAKVDENENEDSKPAAKTCSSCNQQDSDNDDEDYNEDDMVEEELVEEEEIDDDGMGYIDEDEDSSQDSYGNDSDDSDEEGFDSTSYNNRLVIYDDSSDEEDEAEQERRRQEEMERVRRRNMIHRHLVHHALGVDGDGGRVVGGHNFILGDFINFVGGYINNGGGSQQDGDDTDDDE